MKAMCTNRRCPYGMVVFDLPERTPVPGTPFVEAPTMVCACGWMPRTDLDPDPEWEAVMAAWEASAPVLPWRSRRRRWWRRGAVR